MWKCVLTWTRLLRRTPGHSAVHRYNTTEWLAVVRVQEKTFGRQSVYAARERNGFRREIRVRKRNWRRATGVGDGRTKTDKGKGRGSWVGATLDRLGVRRAKRNAALKVLNGNTNWYRRMTKNRFNYLSGKKNVNKSLLHYISWQTGGRGRWFFRGPTAIMIFVGRQSNRLRLFFVASGKLGVAFKIIFNSSRIMILNETQIAIY